MVEPHATTQKSPAEELGINSGEYPFAPNYAEVGGHRLHYVERGAGPTVLMVHGNPSWSFYYRNLVRRLEEDHRAIAVDHIGCGLSDRPPETDYDYTLEQRVQDLGHFIDEVIGDEPLTLVMHDWGGMIGMAWAVQNPQKVERLVLMNTAAFHLPDTKRLPFSLWLARNTGVGALLVEKFNAFNRGATRFCVTETMPPDVVHGYRAPYEGSKEDRVATLRFVQDIPLKPDDQGYDLVSDTQNALDVFADHPIFIGWGQKDFVFDDHFLQRWKEIYPDAEYAIYPDAGHFVLEDREEELGERIATFLKATS